MVRQSGSLFRNISVSLTMAVSLLLANSASARQKVPDTVSATAVHDTQVLLESPIQRRAVMEDSSNPKMQQMAITAESSARRASFGNAELKERYYSFTSQKLIPWLVEITNGDTKEMTRLVGEFNRSPQKFVNRLPANIQQELKVLVSEAEKAQKASGTPLTGQTAVFQQP